MAAWATRRLTWWRKRSATCGQRCARIGDGLQDDVSLRPLPLLWSPALAAGAWICLAEPAKIFRAVFAYNDDEIAEHVANGVIRGAALSLFRRRLLLLLLQQEPVELVIFTHRNQR